MYRVRIHIKKINALKSHWLRIGLFPSISQTKKKICLFLLYEEEINTEVVIERKRNCTNV